MNLFSSLPPASAAGSQHDAASRAVNPYTTPHLWLTYGPERNDGGPNVLRHAPAEVRRQVFRAQRRSQSAHIENHNRNKHLPSMMMLDFRTQRLHFTRLSKTRR